jgi:hypothetical protein
MHQKIAIILLATGFLTSCNNSSSEEKVTTNSNYKVDRTILPILCQHY